MKFLNFIIICFVLFACKNDQKGKNKQVPPINDEQLVQMNQYLVEKDRELITSYMKRRGWEMQKSGSGLWYMIYEKGHGAKAEKGNIATINYRIELLDGTLCYSSDSLGSKSFVIGKGNTESGLEEGILYLHEGDKARFILPPHLAHHLLGDENKIPPRSVIVYYIELLKITRN